MDAERDARVTDGSGDDDRDAATPDACVPLSVAVGDAGPAGPAGALAEPDPAPGELRSDLPDAASWRDADPTLFPVGLPGAELVGSAIPLDQGSENGGTPRVVWGDGQWSVLWTEVDRTVRFRVLGADGALASGVRTTLAITGEPGQTTLAYSYGRYAVLSNTQLSIVGRDGNAVSSPATLRVPLPYPEVVRDLRVHAWLALGAPVHEGTGSGGSVLDPAVVRSVWLDDDATPRSPPFNVGATTFSSAAAVSLWSSAYLLTTNYQFLAARLDPDAVRSDPTDFGGPLPGVPIEGMPVVRTEAAAYRDEIVVASEFAGLVSVAIGSPSSTTAPAEAFPVADVTAGRDGRYDGVRPGLAAADERGYVGLAYVGASTDVTTRDEVAFRLLRPMATRPAVEGLGGTLTVVTGEGAIAGVAAAWSGEEFLVVWWAPNRSGCGPHMFAQRIRPHA